MFKRTKIYTGVLVALGGPLALVAPPAFAQTAAPAASTERVEVTGSRIKTIDATSSSPVSTVSASELNASQPVAVEEVIKSLPNAVPSIGPGTNNGAGGGATIDLRGLGTGSTSGASRTLVLMNGRRIVPFNLSGFVDTNTVPLALVDRTEIVTGGASAVYGADAVAGVVNFVLRKNFSGFEASTSYGTSAEGDANRYRIDVTMGANLADNRGNVVLSLGKTKTDPLLQGQRSIGQRAIGSNNGQPQGSQTDVPVQFLGLPGGLGNKTIDLATGRLVDPNPAGFNFNPVNYYQTPLERQQVTALANYVINERAEVYAELFHTRSDVVQNLAGSGTFFNSFPVPIGNPFIPEAARQQLCTAFAISAANCVVGNTTPVTLSIGRRFTELGPRIGSFENKTTQWTLGVKGSLFGSWSYDAYISRGEADQVRTLGNWGSLSKVRQALDAVSTTACRNPANGCVPLNVFGGDGSITPAMIGFFNLDSVQMQTVEQDILAFSATGDIGFKSPWARSPMSAAIGLERRDLFAGNKSDSASQIQGEVLGTGAPLPDRRGNITLKEVYAEVLLPLAQNKPFAHQLSLDVGLRATEFNAGTSDSYNTHKIGGEWAPVRGLRFRGMVQKATRAPSINELFAPQVSGLSNLATDPCQGNLINAAQANTPGTLSNLCRLTGVPVSQIGLLPSPSAGQINNLSGGNPALGPEEADTTTLGLVWEPAFARGLTVTLDFYKIELQKAISGASVTDVLTQCYSAASNPNFAFNEFCSLVFRNPVNGTFNGSDAKGVFTALSNLGKYATKGMDLSVNYRVAARELGLDPKWGRFDVGLNYNKVDKLKFQATPASVNRDCNGYYSVACGNAFGSPNFKQKWTQRTTWAVGDWTLGYVWRHLGAVIEEPGGTEFFPAFASIKKYDYVDLNASWSPVKNVRLSLSINNAFDKRPPLVGNTIGTTSANSGNTFPQTYDVIGRYYNFGVNVKF